MRALSLQFSIICLHCSVPDPFRSFSVRDMSLWSCSQRSFCCHTWLSFSVSQTHTHTYIHRLFFSSSHTVLWFVCPRKSYSSCFQPVSLPTLSPHQVPTHAVVFIELCFFFLFHYMSIELFFFSFFLKINIKFHCLSCFVCSQPWLSPSTVPVPASSLFPCSAIASACLSVHPPCPASLGSCLPCPVCLFFPPETY